MEILHANSALIERLLNDFDLSPRARQFVLSLRSWKDANRVLSKNQISALNHIEKSYLNPDRGPRGAWQQQWNSHKKEIAAICAKYYAENPPYFNDLSHRVLNEEFFVPTEIEFNKLTENKYAKKVLAEHHSKPLHAKAAMVCLREPAIRRLDMSELRDIPLMILKTNAGPVIRAASGSKRYLVLPITSDTPFLVEERDIKKYKINH
jgi:hypothetical protein|tara:strand:- start:88 stop:708 length:621 start_codon:yes stop_codon:yes gene_type:complete